MDSLDQKLAALSKRSAAEIRRMDREHGEHTRRLEALEEHCRNQLDQAAREVAAAEATKAAQQMRAQLEERLQQDFKRVSEDLSQLATEAQRKHRQCSEALEGLARHIDGSSESLETWRRDMDVQAKGLVQDVKKLQTWSSEFSSWKTDADGRLAATAAAKAGAKLGDETELGLSAASAEKLEEACRTGWEAAVRRERKAASERLAESCAELTQHLNEMREELLDQRAQTGRCSEELHTSRQEAQRGQKLRDMWLEAQVGELGAALAAQIAERLQQPQGTPQRGRSQDLQDFAAKEVNKALDVAREEARIVHHEVMSLDMRVATLEATSAKVRTGAAGSFSPQGSGHL